jgi:hypothetical protein
MERRTRVHVDPKASGVSQGDGGGSRAGGMRLVVANVPAIYRMVIPATLNELWPHAQVFASMDFDWECSRLVLNDSKLPI